MKLSFLVIMGLSVFAPCVQADPVVNLTTPLGDITVQLHGDKPQTVANFLAYINSGRYTNSFSHRLVSGFVLQGGGYTLQGGTTVTPVPTFAPVVNEYSVGQTRSNVFGTLAMAKVGGDPNSATSQWFFNLADNSANLDTQNGGFTVFGDVISGLNVLTLFNTTFNQAGTGGRGVYDASSALGADFTTMPLLAGSLTTGNLIYTTWSIVTKPTLSITRSNSATVAISWSASLTGWALQQNPSLTTSSSWTNVTTSPTVVNGQNQVAITLSPSDSRSFFRLKYR